MSTHTYKVHTSTRIKSVQGMLPVLLTILFGASATIPARAADTILIVTTVGDLGGSCPGANCTLRAAIAYANAYPAQDQIIGFNISGACPRTIKVFSALPTITDTLSIRGYTQSGAAQNTSELGDNATLCIQLQAASSGSNIATGLRFAPTDNTDKFDVSGLSIGRGFDDAIRIEGGNYVIAGNFLGVAADGTTVRLNAYNGVHVVASNSYFATTRVIGGTAVADRNLISGNGTGVSLGSGGGNTVRNNFIGTSRSGTAAVGNLDGVYASSISNTIIDNVISGNDSWGVRLEGNGGSDYVGLNRIGLKSFAFCLPPCTPDYALGNGEDGVRIAGTSGGHDVAANDIAYNGGNGITVTGSVRYVSLSANSMHDNSGLGIDLGDDGVSPNDNDATAPPNAPNRLINYPVLSSAKGSAEGGQVSGFLESINDTYTIEFFADATPDPSMHGEGREYLGSGEVTISNAPIGNNGLVSFTLPISSTSNLVGKYISATARGAYGGTSEFGLARVYTFSDVIFANGFESP